VYRKSLAMRHFRVSRMRKRPGCPVRGPPGRVGGLKKTLQRKRLGVESKAAQQPQRRSWLMRLTAHFPERGGLAAVYCVTRSPRLVSTTKVQWLRPAGPVDRNAGWHHWRCQCRHGAECRALPHPFVLRHELRPVVATELGVVLSLAARRGNCSPLTKSLPQTFREEVHP